mgnify:CR=1 FL=1
MNDKPKKALSPSPAPSPAAGEYGIETLAIPVMAVAIARGF